MNLFISYSQSDATFVQRLATDLRDREAFDVWLDKWEVNPGDRIVERIEEGLSKSEIFLFVLSPASVASQWASYERQAWVVLQVEDEKRAAAEGHPPKRILIPILYQDCEVPAFLEAIQYVKINDQIYEHGFKALTSAIHRIPQRPRLRSEDNETIKADVGVPIRKYILNLLKALLDVQFDEVAFIYNMPRSYLPFHLAQVQKAIHLIEYAEQHEGPKMVKLLNTIYEVAPHFKNLPS